MIYYNQALQRGLRRFMEETKDAGCSGMIIPDLAAERLRESCRNWLMQLEIGLNFFSGSYQQAMSGLGTPPLPVPGFYMRYP